MDVIQTPEEIAAYAGATFGGLAGVKYGKAHRIKKNGKYDVDDLKAPKDVDDVKPDVKKKDADVGKVGNEGGSKAIPNVKNATINPKKITEYALNPYHPVGGNNAKVFESALGYNQSNADDLM